MTTETNKKKFKYKRAKRDSHKIYGFCPPTNSYDSAVNLKTIKKPDGTHTKENRTYKYNVCKPALVSVCV